MPTSPAISPNIDSAACKKLHFSPIPKQEKFAVSVRFPTHDQDISVGISVGNCVLSYSVLQEMFDMTVCKECLIGQMKVFDTQTRCGCASYLLLTCDNCKISKQFWSVHGKFRQEIQIGDKAIPKRNELIYGAVLGARLIGIGSTKAALYHACINIPSPGNRRTFTEVQRDLIVAAKKIANDTMDCARDEIRLLQNTPLDEQYVRTVISFDGAYQMRTGKSGGGFSRYCFAAAISVSTAKVITYGIASNSCKLCVEYQSRKRTGAISSDDYDALALKHEPVCTAKYSDYASVQLESAIAPSIVCQALDRGVVFSGIVTDGDNKTFEVLKKANLYEDLNVEMMEHMECLSHVAKRMKINLCKRQEKILKDSRTSRAGAKRFYQEKLSMSEKDVRKELKEYTGTLRRTNVPREDWDSGASLPIKHLSDSMAGQISSYYRIAVKRNAGDIDAIIESVNAIPLHLGATDSNAEENHRNCPKHPDSWCRYQRAKSLGEVLPHHPNFLTQSVVDLIMEVFTSFGYNSPEFVRKIGDGWTSNHNEALHSVLWSMVHKNEPVSFEIMELGSALAIIRYNEGYNGILKVFSSIGVDTTGQLEILLQEFDNKRILKSADTIREQQKRYAKKQLRGKKVTSQLKRHGEGYASGKYSGAQKATSSESGDEGVTQATTNPPSDSEVACPPQPQMSTRAKRIVRRPNRFLESSDEDDSD